MAGEKHAVSSQIPTGTIAYKVENEELHKAIHEFREEILEQKQTIRGLQLDLSMMVKESADCIAEKERGMATMASDYAKREARFHDRCGEFDPIHEELEMLQDKVHIMTGRIADLESEKAGIDSDAMTKRIAELESENAGLESEKGFLQDHVEAIEKALIDSEEQQELGEHTSSRWRDSNSVLCLENDSLLLYINRLGNRIGGLEIDVVRKHFDIRNMQTLIASRQRRRVLMLQCMVEREKMIQDEGLVNALFKVR